MESDLFIAFERDLDLRTRQALRSKIIGLGDWFQFQPCLFYVRTPDDPAQILTRLCALAGGSTHFVIVDLSAGLERVFGSWEGVPLNNIRSIWSQIQGETESFASMPQHFSLEASVAKSMALG